MKKILTLLLLLTTLSMADFIGGEVNVGYYSHSPSGTSTYDGDTIEIEKDLKLKDEADLFLKAYIEHPLPIIPNIKVAYTSFSHKGNGVIDNSFVWGDKSFRIGSQLESHFDLDIYDVALYYEILDNWLNADVGINIKYIDSSIGASSRTIDESAKFTLPIPMLYAKARLDIPTTDLSFQVEGNYLNYNDHKFYDVEAGARYTFMLGFGVEAGYKALNLTIDNIDDTSFDADFSGLYGKLVWDF